MSSEAYIGTAERTFGKALIHLLESEYRLLGSRRVLELLVKDVAGLVEEFYPLPERMSSGWMVFTGTKASGGKIHPGQGAGDHELVTLAWPVLLPEDLEYLATIPETRTSQQDWRQRRLIRLIEYGWNHPSGPVLLTLADLAAMLGMTTVQVSQELTKARQETGKPLLTKGYYFDQGMKPTHKGVIIDLYEAGKDEAAIGQISGHDPKSVGQYIRDYERVKLMLKRHEAVDKIARLIDMQPAVVNAYADLVKKYHPELMPGKVAPPQAG
jgi:hypothetical protein